MAGACEVQDVEVCDGVRVVCVGSQVSGEPFHGEVAGEGTGEPAGNPGDRIVRGFWSWDDRASTALRSATARCGWCGSIQRLRHAVGGDLFGRGEDGLLLLRRCASGFAAPRLTPASDQV